MILTQTGLPDPLEQALNHKPVFDGRLSVREIQRGWELKAELVTLSACETALGRDAGGEGFVGFTQALLDVGDAERLPVALEGRRHGHGALDAAVLRQPAGSPPGLSQPMPKAEALAEAKEWLRNLTTEKVEVEVAALERGQKRKLATPVAAGARKADPRTERPFSHPYFWAAFVLVGDAD